MRPGEYFTDVIDTVISTYSTYKNGYSFRKFRSVLTWGLLIEINSILPRLQDCICTLNTECTGRYLAECYMESPGHGCVDEGLLLLRKTIALYTTHFSGLDTSTLSTNDLLINALLKQVLDLTYWDELLFKPDPIHDAAYFLWCFSDITSIVQLKGAA